MPDADRTALFSSAASAALTGRVAEPADVAAAHTYLMENDTVTGTVLCVDNGARLV